MIFITGIIWTVLWGPISLCTVFSLYSLDAGGAIAASDISCENKSRMDVAWENPNFYCSQTGDSEPQGRVPGDCSGIQRWESGHCWALLCLGWEKKTEISLLLFGAGALQKWFTCALAVCVPVFPIVPFLPSPPGWGRGLWLNCKKSLILCWVESSWNPGLYQGSGVKSLGMGDKPL